MTRPISRTRIFVPALRLAGVLRAVADWIELRQTRRALAQLDPHLLRDIGLDQNTAARESRRPFWHS
jgi:uncharacterized protein YjiS (DUF1127 family)